MSSFENEQFDRPNRPPARLAIGIGVCIAALIVSVFGAFFEAPAFWSGYLAALVFWLGASLGCSAIALLHLLTGGRWGAAIARDLRAGAGTLAIGAAGIVPLLFGAATLYPGAGSSATSVLNEHQQRYLDFPAVAARTITELLIWSGLAAWLLYSFRRQSTAGATPSPRKAALGLIALWLTATMAVVDGVMALTPDWSSSLLPMIEIVGFGLTALAFVIIVRAAELSNALSEADRRISHDLGNLLLAFNLVWVYLAFSQYLITWSGDLPHEVTWYLNRQNPAAAAVAVALILLHFALPFGLLLSRSVKRNPQSLARVAALLLVMRLVAVAWTILPATAAGGFWSAVLTLSNTIILGGLWLALFAAIRRRLPPPPTAPEPPPHSQLGETALKGAQ